MVTATPRGFKTSIIVFAIYIVNHFGGVEGMKEKLCDEGWDQYCEDEDGYESKASDDYEVDVDEYIKTGDPTQELPKDKRGY